MCGRYTLSDPGDLLDELGVKNPGWDLSPRYNIAPTQGVAAVRSAPDGPGMGQRELVALHWGLVPFWAKEKSIGNRMINARGESLAEKPSFRNALRRRRCLILADGFYEWAKVQGGKQPYHIHLRDHRPFVFAGLWEQWNKGPEGPLESCTIITTEANERIRPLHHRMPVILDGDARDLWLDPSVDDSGLLSTVLNPYDDDPIELTPVSRLVNNPRNETPDCLKPVEL